MAISYPAVDGSSAVEESALSDPGSLAQSSAINQKAYPALNQMPIL